MMKKKFLFGIVIPLIIVVLLVAVGSTGIGFSVRKQAEQSVDYHTLVAAQESVLVQTITLTNTFFIPKRYELPGIILCLNDKDGAKPRKELGVSYSEVSRRLDSPTPILDGLFFDYEYSVKQGIDIPSKNVKEVKVFAHLNAFSYDDAESYSGYDEVLLVVMEGNRKQSYGFYGDACERLESSDLEKAEHIPIIDSPSSNSGAIEKMLSDVLQEGQVRTYMVDGIEYEVELAETSVEPLRVRLRINGGMTHELVPGGTYRLPDGKYVVVTSIGQGVSGRSSVAFYIGRKT